MSTPGEVLEAVRAGEITGVVSLHILEALRTVLTRPRFGFDLATVDALIEEIAGFCEVSAVEQSDVRWTTDVDDDPVVEAALRSGVEVVVTGDAHLLSLKVAGVEFTTPAELGRRSAG